MRKKVFILPVVILALLLFVSCAAQSTPVASKASQMVNVTRGDIKINITAAGNLVSAHDAKLTFGSSGKITNVNVGIGDPVPEGALLAQLDTAALERSVIQAQLNVKSAQMALENAKEPKTNTSGTTILSAPDPLNIEIKEFQLQTSKLDLVDAQTNLKNATIIAPFAGLIAEVNVNPGDQVSGTATAIRIIDPTKFKVTVLVNEADINKVNVGANATIQVDAVRSIIYPAKVAHISPVGTIQSNVVNFKVEIELNTESLAASNQDSTQPAQATTGSQGTTQRNQGSFGQASQRTQRSQQGQAPAAVIPAGFQLREGQTVLLSVTVDQANDVLLLPNLALSTRSGRTYVQVVNTAGTIEEKVVQTGISDGQNTQIVSGLQDKDQVAIVQAAASGTNPASKQQQPQGGVVPNINRILK